MKDELDGTITNEIVALRSTTYGYLTEDDHVDKRAKGTKNCDQTGNV